MFTALVVEPDRSVARHLHRALMGSGLARSVGVVPDAPDLMQALTIDEPDAIIIGSLPGDPTPVELAVTLLASDAPPLVAFVTPDPSHAVVAFGLGAVDYVTVAAGSRPFGQRIARLASRLDYALNARHALAGQTVAAGPSYPLALRRLPVKDYTEGTVRLLDPATIVIAQRAGRRVILRTPSHEYPTYFTIEALARRLGPLGFFRAAAATLVNLDFVEHLIPNGDGSYDALLRVGEQTLHATVSRSRARELLALLDPA